MDSPIEPLSAPDVLAFYEAANLGISGHYTMSVTRPAAGDGIGDKTDTVADTESMNEPHDYRHELSLRDAQLRREMDLRQESFRAEQAARDKALDEKFSGFLAAQAERDKASDYRFGRIESDLSSIKGDLKTVNSDVHEIRRTLARYMGGIAVGAAVAGIVIGAAVKFLFN
ncbi:hypothetical protein [Pseudomonas syringae]|uniref:hypothetical protein n=1 Tax=Pseudomonas syringae TaxID=317 RepID=UPI00200A59A2|nr:hypothetical protein [Pseudomonas syringae]MCK9691337.1 hypothetical protein [Pseudomonas syringae pv. syringae]